MAQAKSDEDVRKANAVAELSGLEMDLPNAYEKIASVLYDILGTTHAVRSLAIWGWQPGVYVITGIPPATRYSDDHFLISPGPVQAYRGRFLDDDAQNPPTFSSTLLRKALSFGPIGPSRMATNPTRSFVNSSTQIMSW